MLKKAKLTYRGINQDITKSKRSPEFYFDAENIRIQATDSGTTGSVTNDKGNVLIYTLPSGQQIIGHAVLKKYLVTISTNGNGIDKITRIDLSDYSSLELFSGNLNLRTSNYCSTEVYYESEDIQKVYWVDGRNQLRHINIITDSAYDSNDAKLFDACPEVSFSAPYVSSIDYGGIHTAGMIQYAYNLIKKNGSQSAISPISELYPLNKNLGGGKVNEYVGKILNVTIDSVDTNYDIIRLYAIKYTSYNEQPSINIIAEESIGGNTLFNFSDDGRVIRAISADQFLFLGGTPLIPNTITSKYNRLIIGNVKEEYFNITTEQFDTRAYRFPENSNTTTIKNSGDLSTTSITWDGAKIVGSLSGEIIDSDHDCINDLFDPGILGQYNFRRNSSVIGASGTNIDVEIVQRTIAQIKEARNVLKSNEIYRLGIEFYNKRGQSTEPKWMCDLKVPQGNLNDNYNTLKVTLRNTSELIALGVVGWRVLRVERTDADKTVLCQGIVNPSIYQNYKDSEITSANLTVAKGQLFANQGWSKLPSPFMRNVSDLNDKIGSSQYPRINKILHGNPLCLPIVPTATPEWPYPEIIKQSYSSSTHNTYEETRLFQLYSPEITFLNTAFSENLQYRPVGKLENTLSNSGVWCKQVSTESSYQDEVAEGELQNEIRATNTISLYASAKLRGAAGKAEPNQNGILGPAGGSTKRMNYYQYWRKYVAKPFVQKPFTNTISGTPTVTGKGESSKVYSSNGISNVSDKYKFSNHLYSMVTDNNPGDADRTDDPIISVNSIGGTCVNIVDSAETPLETVLATHGITDNNTTGLVEIYRNVSNQYGGNTFEARSRNSYLRIGRYQPIATTENQIDQAGDVFAAVYRFERIIPNTTQIVNYKYLSLTEIVEFPVETTVDLLNRSDYSVDGWDAYFQPTYDEYHNYNRVYSQQPIFNRTTANPFTFQERKVFDNRINATKVKTSGELVDSWTDILVNEELYVDGKYGSITEVVHNNDIVYCVQEQAVSILEIQPRVQTVSTDGTSIELGRGSVLYNYKYINTNSGSVNQQAVFKSQNSVYYIDVINKSINRIVGAEVIGLSDVHGLHSFMFANLDYNTLKNSNLVNGCFDQVTNDAYFTTPSFTISFNEQTNAFTSRYSFIPKRYFYTSYGLFSSANNNTIWKHGAGSYGSYYGVSYPSYITLISAPEPDADCIFNNGEFKSEVYLNGVDVPTKTISSVHCWNEYQNSGSVALTVGGNIRRKFRDWNFFIPRVNGSPLQRMRGQWLYIKLGFDNSLNEKLVLHDIIIGYEAINKI